MPETSTKMMENRLGKANPERPLEQEETHSTWPWATVPGQGIRTNLLSQSLQQSSKHISLWSRDGAQCAQCLPATHKALLLTRSTQ